MRPAYAPQCATGSRTCLVCGAVLVRRPTEKLHKFLERKFCGTEHFRLAESALHKDKFFQKFLGNPLIAPDEGEESKLYGTLRYEDIKLKAR